MTDNEIIKALECCSKAEICADCEKMKCPLFLGLSGGCKYVDKENQLYSDALDLITRQQAEIDKLNAENMLTISERNAFRTSFYDVLKQLKTAKSEAYKEFANEIKMHKRRMRGFDLCNEFWDYAVLVEDIENTLMEMVSDDDNA